MFVCLIFTEISSLQFWWAGLLSFAGQQHPSSFVSENRCSAMSLWYPKECFFISPSMQKNGQRWKKQRENWAPDNIGSTAHSRVSSCPWPLKNSFPCSLSQSTYCSKDENSQPEVAAGAVFGIKVDMEKRGTAVCLFSMYSYYTSKLTVNIHLHNECLSVKMPSLHGKGCSICT